MMNIMINKKENIRFTSDILPNSVTKNPEDFQKKLLASKEKTNCNLLEFNKGIRIKLLILNWATRLRIYF